jgi:hypothetical protein
MHPKSTKNSSENCALRPLARVSIRVKISRLFGTGSGLRVGCFEFGLFVFWLFTLNAAPGRPLRKWSFRILALHVACRGSSVPGLASESAASGSARWPGFALEDSVIPAPWYSGRVVLSARPDRPAGGARLDSRSVECRPGLARVNPSVGSFVCHGPGPLAVSPVRRPGLGYCWISGDPLSHCARAVSPHGPRPVSAPRALRPSVPVGARAVSPQAAHRPSVPDWHSGR